MKKLILTLIWVVLGTTVTVFAQKNTIKEYAFGQGTNYETRFEVNPSSYFFFRQKTGTCGCERLIAIAIEFNKRSIDYKPVTIAQGKVKYQVWLISIEPNGTFWHTVYDLKQKKILETVRD